MIVSKVFILIMTNGVPHMSRRSEWYSSDHGLLQAEYAPQLYGSVDEPAEDVPNVSRTASGDYNNSWESCTCCNTNQ